MKMQMFTPPRQSQFLALIIIAMFALIFNACQKQKVMEPKPPPEVESKTQPLAQTQESTATILGKKLKNPYTVSNMRKAARKVQQDRAKGHILIDTADDNAQIIATSAAVPVSHLYLKFKPKSEQELDILLSDSNLILYEYPLDQEIENLGNYYRDPDIPDDQPTPQYCSVPVDYALPSGVEYEILDSLFIPEEVYEAEWHDEALTSTDTLVDRLVGHALIAAGHVDTTNASNKRICLWNCFPKWRPKGRIRVWDPDKTRRERYISDYREEERVRRFCESAEEGGDPNECEVERYTVRIAIYSWRDAPGDWVPVEGVRVGARRWFTTRKGTTDKDGYYRCDGEFERSANYSFEWKRADFSVGYTKGNPDRGLFNLGKYRGPKKTGDWSVDIGETHSDGTRNRQHTYSIVFKAAHHYYYKNILGLRRPPSNQRVKIAVYTGTNSDANGDHRAWARISNLLPRLRVWRNGRGFRGIFATSIHELAHASHWELRKRWWSGTASKVKESWAEGVEYYLTRLVYPNYNGISNRNFAWMRDPNGGGSKYTPLVIDLIDNTNQGAGNIAFPFDRVTGYTIAEIEAVLRDCASIRELRDQLLRRYDKPTDQYLNELFDQYINLRR